jgi:hypothetical protein
MDIVNPIPKNPTPMIVPIQIRGEFTNSKETAVSEKRQK